MLCVPAPKSNKRGQRSRSKDKKLPYPRIMLLISVLPKSDYLTKIVGCHVICRLTLCVRRAGYPSNDKQQGAIRRRLHAVVRREVTGSFRFYPDSAR